MKKIKKINYVNRIGNFLTGSLFGSSNNNASHQQIINSNNKKPLTNPLSRGDSEHSIDSLNSSRGMSFISGNADNYSDMDRHDKLLLGDLASKKEEFIDFEFNSPDEIRIILNKFLKSGMLYSLIHYTFNFNEYN